MTRRRTSGNARAASAGRREATTEPKESTAAAPAEWIWWSRAVWLPAVLIALAAVMNVPGILAMIRYPAELNFGEGVSLYEAFRLQRGLPIYKPFMDPPLWTSTYPPLFAWLCSLGSTASFAWARSLNFASSLVAGLTLGAVTWRTTRQPVVALAAAGLWFASLFTDAWSGVARVDMLARALQAVGVAIVVFGGRRWAAVIPAALVCAVAMLAKQNAWAGGLTCGALLLWQSRRAAFAFGGVWVAVTLLLYGCVQWASQGQFFASVFGMTARGLDVGIWFEWTRSFVETEWALLVAVLVAAWRFRGEMTWPWSPTNSGDAPRGAVVFALAFLAGVPNMILAGQDGVDVNYYFDAHWGLAGFAALVLARGPDVAGGGLRMADIAGRWIGVAVICVHSGLMMLAPLAGPTRDQSRHAAELIALLRATPGPVLCEFVGTGLVAGHEPVMLPYLSRKLEERGLAKSDAIAADIRRGAFGAILLTDKAAGRFSPEILKAVETGPYNAQMMDPGFKIDGNEYEVLLRRKP